MNIAVKPTPGSVQRDIRTNAGPQDVISEPLVEEQTRHNEIARLAFTIWQQRDSPSSSPEDDWFEAERRFRGA